MKQLTIVLVAALVSGVCAFFLVQRRHAPEIAMLDHAQGDELSWIRAEFGLNEAQFAAVKKLHDDYSVVCARHCSDIAAAQARFDALTDTRAPAAELEAARRDVIALEQVCNTATRAHIHRVAEVMPPEQGARYIATVEPHLAHSPHDGSRGLAPH